MIDEALSNFGIIAAATEVIEIRARLRCCVDDSACARQMAVANPDNPKRPCRRAAELMGLFDKDYPSQPASAAAIAAAQPPIPEPTDQIDSSSH